jgi:outer membrane protein
LLRVAQAYFAILSATDQLATNRNEREAFGALLNQARSREQTGISPRSDVEQAQAFTTQQRRASLTRKMPWMMPISR